MRDISRVNVTVHRFGAPRRRPARGEEQTGGRPRDALPRGAPGLLPADGARRRAGAKHSCVLPLQLPSRREIRQNSTVVSENTAKWHLFSKQRAVLSHELCVITGSTESPAHFPNVLKGFTVFILVIKTCYSFCILDDYSLHFFRNF